MDQFKALSETGRDGYCQMTRLALESQQKMIGLNIDAAQDFIEQSGHQLEQCWADMSRVDPMTAWPLMMARNAKCALAINLLFYNLTSRLFKDLSTASRQQIQTINSEMQQEVGRYTSASRQLATTLAKQGNGLASASERKVA